MDSAVSVSWWKGEVVLLYLAVAVSRIAFGVMIIIFPSYLAGYSNISLAIALALYPVLESVSAVPIGAYCDTRGRRRVFLVGMVAMGVLMVAIGFTRNLDAVAGLHAFMGLAAAAITVSSLTMITDLTTAANRGKGMGSFDFANIGGYAIGLLAGGRLLDYFGKDLYDAFFVTSVLLFSALGFSLLLLREPSHLSRAGRFSFNPIQGMDSRTKAILPIWLSLTSLIGIVFFLPRALKDAGVTASATSNLLFVGILALGIGSIGFGALSDRLGREKTMIIGVVGLFGLLISLGLSLGGTGGPNFLTYLPILGPSALATSALVPSILASVGDRADKERRGASMGLYSLMLSAGIAVGELVAGFASTLGGLAAILYAGGLIFLIASLISFFMLMRLRREQSRVPA
ncbi:MAG: MFS transporter [Thaumarchaeota archaeon]|nr:MFS transporter [Nitrososphaerota archaeon]